MDQQSLALASRRDYLDQLFRIYPVYENLRRELPTSVVQQIKRYYDACDSQNLLRFLLKLELFPIKDSYIAYLIKHDKTALERNPITCQRISGILYELGFNKIIGNSSNPKENNRQIGPLFKNWLFSGALTPNTTDNFDTFLSSSDPILLRGSDAMMKDFASTYLGYVHDKGLDLIAKFNNKFVIGEVKFLTDFGGHQNAQFNDAISVVSTGLNATSREVIKVAILDGVLYINTHNKMHRTLLEIARHHPVFSALFLRNFLYSL